jgi:uncharacterized protein YdcH (DUF465 family)
METSNQRFTIIFEELRKISMELDNKVSSKEAKEYEEIETLRKIVCEMQSPPRVYFTST